MLFRLIAVVAKHAAQTVLLLLLLSAATFALSALIPGDYFTTHQTDPTIQAETLSLLRARYGLDRPILVQYGRWLGGLVRMDLGESLFYRAPVQKVVLDSASKTLWISLPALLCGLFLGVGIGTLHGAWRNRWQGQLMDGLFAIFLCSPSLLLGILALLLAARTGWFPVGGMESVQSAGMAAGFRLLDRMHHLVLPVLCLTIPIFATVERVQCAAVESTLKETFLQSARARGLSPWRFFSQHLLRPSLNPVLSMSGPLIGGILSGSLVLEVIFSWPGLGQLTYQALFNRDIYLLLGCVMASGVLLVVGNQVADLLLHHLDPRTRAGAR